MTGLHSQFTSLPQEAGCSEKLDSEKTCDSSLASVNRVQASEDSWNMNVK